MMNRVYIKTTKWKNSQMNSTIVKRFMDKRMIRQYDNKHNPLF